MPGMPGAAGDDQISKLMQFVKAQPQPIVCGRLGIQPLSDARRRELLADVNLFDALETVARLQARWDVAYTTTQRPDVVEADFLKLGTGEASRRARKRVVTHRDMLVSPRATAQLQREIIEYASTDEAAPPINLNTLVHMLLSITSEQNMHDGEFARDVPTGAEAAKIERVVPKMGLEETHEYAKPLIADEIASSLFNLPLKYEIVLSNSYDLWFTPWAPRSKTTGLGATPAEAFKIATGVDLLDVMRLGARIVKRSTARRQVRFTRDELLAHGAARTAIEYLFANMALPLDDYKVELQGDREKGAIGHQRYTLTRFPFLALDDDTFVMLRHQWALDRLCGGQLYFEAWDSLNSKALRERFKTAMSDAFEQFVGAILHRIFDKSPHLRQIVDEPEMQAAWEEKKGQPPSVCDWMLFGEGHCILIDATNHAVKEKAAQGLATWDECSADMELIFTEGKFGQLLSTIGLVKQHSGWGNEKVDTKTMFTPLVVVPDAGVVNGLLTQFDINLRGHEAFKHLQPQGNSASQRQLGEPQGVIGARA
jgi:hypothetical protein